MNKEEFLINNKLFFMFNETYSVSREEPLIVSEFISDLKDVFEKHSVKTIKEGAVGFDNEGNFGIANSKIDLSGN